MATKSYTRAVGTKFHEDGQVRFFAGNTIVSHILENSHVFREALWAQSEVMRLPFASKYAFLPPHSFHMTVFELLCDQVRDQQHWSSHLDLAIGLRETDVYFEKTATPIGPPSELQMRLSAVSTTRHAYIGLVPVNEKAEARIRAYRDRLSESTGVRFPNHDEYHYHISLAYMLEDLTEAEQEKGHAAEEAIETRLGRTLAEVTIPAPRVTYFDHMHAFHRDKVSTSRWP